MRARTGWLVLVAAACLDKPAPPGAADGPSPPGPDAPVDGARPDGASTGSRTAFVTNDLFDGVLGGVLGADNICQNSADLVGLSGVYKAWLSDSSSNPFTRLTQHPGPYVRTDGVRIADNWDDLTDGVLLAPLDRNEMGGVAVGGDVCGRGWVWSNTTSTGFAVSTLDHCIGWNATIGVSNAGDLRLMTEGWTHSMSCPNISCTTPLALYCFEQ